MAHDLADLARRAAEIGGEEAIASVTRRDELVVRCGSEGSVLPPRASSELVIRLLVRDGAGRVGVARASGAGTTDELILLADRAHALAAAAHIDLTPLADVKPGLGHEGFDPRTAELDAGVAVDAAVAATRSIGLGVGRVRSATWRSEVVELAVARSGGGSAGDRRTGAHLVGAVVDGDGRLVGYAQGSAPRAHGIDAIGVGIAATPLELPVLRGGGPVVLRHDEPLVLLPPAVAPLVEALARAACTGHSHATGTSPYTGRLGSPVASEAVHLTDTPRSTATFGRAIDVEGSPALTVHLIQSGVAERVLHDAASAAEVGDGSTGHAAELGGSPAGPAARNLVLASGTAAGVAEMISQPDRAIVVGLITSVTREGPGSTRFTAIGRAAYATDRGLPSHLVGDVAITGDLVDVLAYAEALSIDAELVATIDRAPERTTATVCPAVRTAGLVGLVG
jgi:predicted Zn-dependent protease